MVEVKLYITYVFLSGFLVWALPCVYQANISFYQKSLNEICWVYSWFIKDTRETEDRLESISLVRSLPLNPAINIAAGLSYNDVQVNVEI